MSEGVTDTHPGVYAVLDEGCNSTVHGTDWIANAAQNLASIGFSTRFSPEGSRTFKGLSGETETLRFRTIPFSIKGIDGESHEIKGWGSARISERTNVGFGYPLATP